MEPAGGLLPITRSQGPTVLLKSLSFSSAFLKEAVRYCFTVSRQDSLFFPGGNYHIIVGISPIVISVFVLFSDPPPRLKFCAGLFLHLFRGPCLDRFKIYLTLPLDYFYKFHVDGAAHPRFCFSPLWFLPRVVRNAPGLDGARVFIGFCFGGSRLYLLLAFSTS